MQAMCRGKEEHAESSKALKATHVWSAVTRFLKSQQEVEIQHQGAAAIDLEDEYQKACRTQSYVDFTHRVALARQSGSDAAAAGSMSPKPRSFELLAAALLEPDQERVLAILMTNRELRNKPEIFQLVSDYFEEGKKSSTLCTSLLKNIEKSRERCQGMKGILSLGAGGDGADHTHLMSDGDILREICSLDEGNLFSGAVLQQFQPVHEHYSSMQKKLEKIRKSTGRKLRFARRCLKASRLVVSVACYILLLVTTLAAFLALAAMIVGCKVFTLPINFVVRRLNRRKKQRTDALEKQWRQIEAVTRGTFVVVQDLDTMKQLVMRLGSEIEFTNRTLAFCVRHKEDGLILRESLQRLRKNQSVLSQLLDDLEESIFLSFLSMNRARCLAVRELCLTN